MPDLPPFDPSAGGGSGTTPSYTQPTYDPSTSQWYAWDSKSGSWIVVAGSGPTPTTKTVGDAGAIGALPGASSSTYQDYVGSGPNGSIYRDAGSGAYWYNGAYYPTLAEVQAEVNLEQDITPKPTTAPKTSYQLTTIDGVPYTFNPVTRQVEQVIDPATGGAFAPKTSTPSYGGGGGGSASRATTDYNPYGSNGAALSAARASVAAATGGGSSSGDALQIEQMREAAAAEQQRLQLQFDYAQLQQQAQQNAAQNALAQRNAAEAAAKDYGSLVSSTDTAALPAFLQAGGGNIMNAIHSGASNLTMNALTPGAMALENARAAGATGDISNPYATLQPAADGSSAPATTGGGTAGTGVNTALPLVAQPTPGSSAPPSPSAPGLDANGQWTSPVPLAQQAPWQQYATALGVGPGTLAPGTIGPNEVPHDANGQMTVKPGDSYMDSIGNWHIVDANGNIVDDPTHNAPSNSPFGPKDTGPQGLPLNPFSAVTNLSLGRAHSVLPDYTYAPAGTTWTDQLGIGSSGISSMTPMLPESAITGLWADPKYNAVADYNGPQYDHPFNPHPWVIGGGEHFFGPGGDYASMPRSDPNAPPQLFVQPTGFGAQSGGRANYPNKNSAGNQAALLPASEWGTKYYDPGVYNPYQGVPKNYGGGTSYGGPAFNTLGPSGLTPPVDMTAGAGAGDMLDPATRKRLGLPAYARGGKIAGAGIVGDPPPGSNKPNRELVIAPHGATVIPLKGRKPNPAMVQAAVQAAAGPKPQPLMPPMPPMPDPGTAPMPQMPVARFAFGGLIPQMKLLQDMQPPPTGPVPLWMSGEQADNSMGDGVGKYAAGGAIRPSGVLIARQPLMRRQNPISGRVPHFATGGSIDPYANMTWNSDTMSWDQNPTGTSSTSTGLTPTTGGNTPTTGTVTTQPITATPITSTTPTTTAQPINSSQNTTQPTAPTYTIGTGGVGGNSGSIAATGTNTTMPTAPVTYDPNNPGGNPTYYPPATQTPQPTYQQPQPSTNTGGGTVTTQPITAVPTTGSTTPPTSTSAYQAGVNPYLDQVYQYRTGFQIPNFGPNPYDVEFQNLSRDEQQSVFQGYQTAYGMPANDLAFEVNRLALTGPRRTPYRAYLNQGY